MNNDETIIKSVSHSVYQMDFFMFADLFNKDHGLSEAIYWKKETLSIWLLGTDPTIKKLEI